MHPRYPVLFLVLAVAAGAAFLYWQQQRKEALAERAGALRSAEAEYQRVRESNRLAREAIPPAPEPGLQEEIEKARREVAALEQQLRAPRPVPGPDLSANRDPFKGLVPLEHFERRGWATPQDAFQTIIWAAKRGDEAELLRALALTESVRVKARDVWARMGPEVHRDFPTPESLLTLALAYQMLNQDAYQILDLAESGPGRGTLTVRRQRGNNSGNLTSRLPFEQTAEGWKVPLPESAVDGLVDFLADASATVRAKREATASR